MPLRIILCMFLHAKMHMYLLGICFPVSSGEDNFKLVDRAKELCKVVVLIYTPFSTISEF